MANWHGKESDLYSVGRFIATAGRSQPPFADPRGMRRQRRREPSDWAQPAPSYNRADSREFKVRFSRAHILTKEWQMRALMDSDSLN